MSTFKESEKKQTQLNIIILSVVVVLLLWYFLAHSSFSLGSLSLKSTPSEAQAQSLLQKEIQSQSNGNIRLVSLKKINGVPDGNFYKLEYQLVIEFLATGAWTKGGDISSETSYRFSTSRVRDSSMGQILADIDGTKNVSRGQKETVKGSILFEKTENGWRKFDPDAH
jgi:hypothetical protein